MTLLRIAFAALTSVALPCLLHAQAAFSSSYTERTNCRDAIPDAPEGSDSPALCKGLPGYHVVESYFLHDSRISIVREGDDFTIELTPKREYTFLSYGAKTEWRQYNKVPFAVIQRVTCYGNHDPETQVWSDPKNKIGEYLMVRGINDTTISVDIDVRRIKNANAAAQKAADSLFLVQKKRK